MNTANLGSIVLAASLLVLPGCSPADRTAGNDKDAAATARAAHVTNDTDSADASSPAAAPGGDRQATGTTGSTTADEANGAGPDAVITMKIQAKYAGDAVVKGRNIDVDTADGVVTLTGEVDSLHEKDAAEQLARETAGVKRVIDELKVGARR